MTDLLEIKSSVEKLTATNADFIKKYDQKLENIGKQTDEIEKKINRPGFGYGGSSNKATQEIMESKKIWQIIFVPAVKS